MCGRPCARCTSTSIDIWPNERSRTVDEFSGNHAAGMVPFDVRHRPGWQPVDVGRAAAAGAGLAGLDRAGAVAAARCGPSELPGRRPYRALYLAGLVFWLLAIHWLRLPHPLLYIGWVGAFRPISAIYLPVFVGLSRVAVHRFALPLWLAAPIVWTGLELARAHVLTGFLMASLAHTQVNWTPLIQISDLVGEYGVDFVVMLVAACVAEVLWISDCGLRIADCPKPQSTHNPQSKLGAVVVRLLPAVVARRADAALRSLADCASAMQIGAGRTATGSAGRAHSGQQPGRVEAGSEPRTANHGRVRRVVGKSGRRRAREGRRPAGRS